MTLFIVLYVIFFINFTYFAWGFWVFFRWKSKRAFVALDVLSLRCSGKWSASMLHSTNKQVVSFIFVLANAKVILVFCFIVQIILDYLWLSDSLEMKEIVRIAIYYVVLNCLNTHSPSAITCSLAFSLFTFLKRGD